MSFVALLRGVNVGGRNRLAMGDLTRMFVDAGCSDVRTYIQSGNVVFRASDRVAGTLAGTIAAQVGVPVILRNRDEMERVVAAHPFLTSATDPKALHVCFLADLPTAAQVAALDPLRSPPDEFRVIDGEIYLHMPNGMGQTKLTNAWFDSKLKTVSTVRNWGTVNKLLSLMREL